MMNTQFNKPSFMTMSAGGIAAGVLATSSAQAQIVTQNPNVTVSDGDAVYFNVEPNSTFSSTGSGQELELDSSAAKLFVGDFPAISQVSATSTLSEGTVVGPDSTFYTNEPLGDSLANGVNLIGFEDNLGGGVSENYGYLSITQSEDDSGGASVFTDTVNTIVFNTAAGQSVTITPEPTTTSLLAAAAGGAGALALYRRNRRGSVIR